MNEVNVLSFPPYGMCGEICYLVYNKGSAALIDAPGNTGEVLSVLGRRGLKLEKILLTHGHFDHIDGLADIAAASGAEVYIHEADLPLLTDNYLNLSEPFGEPPVKGYTGKVHTLSDGDEIDVCGYKTSVLNTPGHTSGSVIYIIGNVMFTGDTIFRNSIGRTDMPGGSSEVMRSTLKMIAEKEWEQPDYKIYSGHTSPTTLKRELSQNPYLKGNASYDDMF